jgi:hypothetical protein
MKRLAWYLPGPYLASDHRMKTIIDSWAKDYDISDYELKVVGVKSIKHLTLVLSSENTTFFLISKPQHLPEPDLIEDITD